MEEFGLHTSETILDSLNDGLYITDTERRILFWNKTASRITGWKKEDVVGHRCLDNILVHVDKDGRKLCDTDFCPLHRCMVTDSASTCPMIVFAQTSSGGRVPLTVSVAPLHDENGNVVGGVEAFRDFSESYRDLERAKRIQHLSMDRELPRDERVGFRTFYLPHDVIGGDYVCIRQIDADRYGFLLADVMGLGVAAALHTMHLSMLWERHFHALDRPAEFARQLNRELCSVVKDESFAMALCGIIDAKCKTLRIASAGGTYLILAHPDGYVERLAADGLPFGMIQEAEYDEREVCCASGDCLLMFTDGAIEIDDAAGRMLGTDGLIRILDSLGYPRSGIRIESLQGALLNYSNSIRLDDDLTILEVRFA